MEEVKLKVLGTVAPYPKGDKNCPGYLIKYKNHNILFDCGNGSTRLLNLPDDLNNLSIFITHLHPDHVGDLASLLQTIFVYRCHEIIKDRIHLYIPDTIEEEYKVEEDEITWITTKVGEKHAIDYEYIKKYADIAGVEIHKIEENTNFKDFEVISAQVPHPIEAYAYRFNSDNGDITYSGDTDVKNNLREFAKNSDLFICESTFLKENKRTNPGHLYTYEAARIAKDANVSKLLLTHFWPEFDKEKYVLEAKEVFPNTEAAVEGKQYILRR